MCRISKKYVKLEKDKGEKRLSGMVIPVRCADVDALGGVSECESLARG
jgi:hypothetical protein